MEEVAANTPSQIEMKQMINKPDVQMRNQMPDSKINEPKNILQDKKKNNYMQNQLDNVDRRRNTIDKTDDRR